MKIRKYVTEGEMLPTGYGIAWRDWCTKRTVCYPLGLNIIAGLLNGIYHALRGGIPAVRDNPRAAYRQGFEDGRKSMES